MLRFWFVFFIRSVYFDFDDENIPVDVNLITKFFYPGCLVGSDGYHCTEAI